MRGRCRWVRRAWGRGSIHGPRRGRPGRAEGGRSRKRGPSAALRAARMPSKTKGIEPGAHHGGGGGGEQGAVSGASSAPQLAGQFCPALRHEARAAAHLLACGVDGRGGGKVCKGRKGSWGAARPPAPANGKTRGRERIAVAWAARAPLGSQGHLLGKWAGPGGQGTCQAWGGGFAFSRSLGGQRVSSPGARGAPSAAGAPARSCGNGAPPPPGGARQCMRPRGRRGRVHQGPCADWGSGMPLRPSSNEATGVFAGERMWRGGGCALATSAGPVAGRPRLRGAGHARRAGEGHGAQEALGIAAGAKARSARGAPSAHGAAGGGRRAGGGYSSSKGQGGGGTPRAQKARACKRGEQDAPAGSRIRSAAPACSRRRQPQPP